jgi:hypothetical protein
VASSCGQIWSSYDTAMVLTVTVLATAAPFASLACLVVEQGEDLQT